MNERILKKCGSRRGLTEFGLIGIAISFSSCALDTGARIRVSMPGGSTNLMSFATGSSAWSVGAPAAPGSYADFNCFGLNVVGDGITPSPICANDPTAGKLGGFAAFSGGTVDVRVPPGSARRIELLGVMTSDQSCPSIAAMDPDSESGPGISAFHLGETTVDVFEDKRVTIQAQYTTAASAIPRMEQCGPGGSSGPGQPDPSWFSSFMAGWWKAQQATWDGSTRIDAIPGAFGPSLTQVAATNRPNYINSGWGGLPLLEFGAIADFLDGPSLGALTGVNTVTLFMVLNLPASPAVGQVIFDSRWNATKFLKVAVGNTRTLLVSADPGTTATSELSDPLPPAGDPVLVELNWMTSNPSHNLTVALNSNVPVDSTPPQVAAGSELASTHDWIRIGDFANSAVGTRISEIVIYNTNFGVPERRQLQCYFKNRYGITAISNADCP